jgi:hypothetical protein
MSKLNPQSAERYRAAERRLWQCYGATPKEHYFDLERLKVRGGHGQKHR